MWFNGTQLSERARRALENEKVTIVSHISGYVHTIYPEATIDKESYETFASNLRDFLVTDLTKLTFFNFLRFKSKFKSLFQFMDESSGTKRYILLERLFEYEHSSRYNAYDSREQLIREIDGDDFHLSPIQGKIILNNLEDILEKNEGKPPEFFEDEFIKATRSCEGIIHDMFFELRRFICTTPKIPDLNKHYAVTEKLNISVDDSREKIITRINRHSKKEEAGLLALYVFREMEAISWLPFVKAAIERNPVCFNGLKGKTPGEVHEILQKMPDESIYDAKRLALPDEVWNFGRGDGIEKALLMADLLNDADKSSTFTIDITNRRVTLSHDGKSYLFTSKKGFNKLITISGGEYSITDKSE
jgi:hypothetical protein